MAGFFSPQRMPRTPAEAADNRVAVIRPTAPQPRGRYSPLTRRGGG
ncbi:hypothetical protein HMPREF3150_02668 [Pseudomonas aeruginosa]|nr:hypothetical protein HMPREF3150_02668 [Pseudomonas aeruginosa]